MKRYYVGCILGLSILLSQHVLAKPAQRIIALSPHAVEMLYAIGAGDAIVATTDYADYPEAAKKFRALVAIMAFKWSECLSLTLI